MMGFEFDENGNFLEWSPLFDNSTKETFLASMLIPTPKGKVIQIINPGEIYDVDIRNEVEQLNNTNDLVRKIQLKIQILSKIDSVDSTNVKVLGGDKFLIAELNKHEEHSIDENYREEIFKNSVSGKLQAIVQAIENIPLAYSSINMSDLRRISNNTPEGMNSASITGMNPMTKFIMQYQNMIGKSVIGIAAVGEKTFMGLSYYYNELVREPNIEKLKKNLDYLTFELKFDRIQGRWIPGVDGILLFFGQPVSVTKRSLTDVNLYAISNINEIREGLFRVNEILERLILLFEYINKDNPKLEKLLKTYKDEQLQLDVELELIKSGASNIQADLIISLLLSAATDNAKELILKRINSGPDTAGIYLNLIMLGFSINDICAFMNSPALQVVVQRTLVNMFDPYNNEFIPLYQMPICADEAKGKIVTRVYKLDSSTRLKLQDFAVKITENDDSYLFVSEYSLKYRLDLLRGDKDKAYLDDCIQAIVLSLVRDKISKDELLTLVNGNSLVQVLVDEIIYLASLIKKAVLDIQTYSQYQDFDIALKNYLADIDEFKHVSSIQRETTLLGTALLGMNKGISTSQLDLVKRIADIENFWDKQETKYETIEDIIKAKPWYAGREKEIEDIIDRAKKAGVTNRRKRGKEKLVRFSFTDYLINLNGYRQATIDYYNLIKDEWNIFDVMERSPLYKAALKAFEVAWLIPTVTITKNKIFSVIRQEIKSQSDVTYLDKFLQLQLELYAEKLLVSNWIEKANIYFPISKGLTIINRKFAKESSSDNMLINLSTPNNRMTFKYWIEEILLPSLILNNEYTWTDEKGQSHTITVSSHNQFLKNLLRGFDGDKATYKLNMRINEIFLSNVASRRFHEIMNGLWELTKLKIGDYSIADYLGLYSICVSQNHYGNDRLTAAFREIARILKDSLVAKYLDSIGELDIQGSQFTSQQLREYLRAIGFDVNDALMAIAKVYNSAANNKNQGKYVREPGGFTYLKWNGSEYSTDRVPSIFPKELTTASITERMEASNNLLRYGLLYCPIKDNRNNILGFFDSDQALDILDGLIQALTLGYITIKHNC